MSESPDSRRGGEPLPESVEIPSIFEHVGRHLRTDGPGLTEGGEHLPDEDAMRAEQHGLGWAAGALDGVLSHHFGGEALRTQDQVTALYEALVHLADQPGPQTRARVRELFLQGGARVLIGPLVERISTRPPCNQDRLYEEMKHLFLVSGHREEVKFSMAVLSCFCSTEDVDLFRTIGRHEEFTFHAAVALAQVVEDPIPDWMELAKRVRGWGKIELVELLLQEPRPEVCDFLLRQGCRNDIMHSYTALSIATGCRLHEALATDDGDPALLAGAAEILQSLAEDAMGGGPNGDMTDYPEGGLAAELFLRRLEAHARTLEEYLAIEAIQSFAARERAEEEFLACGWDTARRSRVLSLCHRILSRPHWTDLAQQALGSADQRIRWLGLAVARRLGLPLHDYLVSSLEREPLNAGLWFELTNYADETGMDEALTLAARLLDLSAITTGLTDEHGTGPIYQLHTCVGFLLQGLVRFPGKGWELVRLALNGPPGPTRGMAMQTLRVWSGQGLPDEIEKVASHSSLDYKQ